MSPQDESDNLKRIESTPAGTSQRFEAKLAALAPRAGQFERDRLMFQAGRASLSAAPADQSGRHWQSARRWGWPAAFSGMAALAASLLLVLVTRPAPPVVERIVRVPIEMPRQPDRSEPNSRHPGDSLARKASGDWLAAEMASRSARDKSLSGGSYLDLRDRVLAMGIDSWQSDGSASGSGAGESPASYHELLDSLLRDG